MLNPFHIDTANIRRIIGATLATTAFFLALDSFAFQSSQVETLSAGAMVGGTPEEQLEPEIRINHVPLRGISPITKIAIIQGAAGDAPEAAPEAFLSRHTAGFRATATANQIRIRLKYRIIPNGQVLASPEAELPPIYGPDPTAFAFQINPSSITAGVLQYVIIAERLDGNGVVISSSAYPNDFTPQADDHWVSVGVAASAGQVIAATGGRFTILDGNPNDGETSVDVPAGLFSAPTEVSLNEVPLNSPLIPSTDGLPAPVAVYSFVTNPPVSGPMKVTVLYPDFQFPDGQDGVIDGTAVREQNASIAIWDGFKWRNIGGLANFNANTLTTRMSAASFVGVFPMGAPAPADLRALRKIITPNGDGVNDETDFNLGTQATEIKIFDVSGHRVKTVTSPTQWDGRDDNGRVVESGVYIYQYEINGERISGVIAVAK